MNLPFLLALLARLLSPYGMVQAVVQLAVAVNSTTHHGSAQHMPRPTTDDLEVRNCGTEAPQHEDVIINLIDIACL